MDHIIGGGGNRAAMNIPPLNTLSVIRCSKCGSICFENVFLLRVLSAIQSPDGQEHIIPEPTFRCSECGSILGTNSSGAEYNEEPNEEQKEPVEEDGVSNNDEQPEEPSGLKLV